jgi:hypothetical protein
MLMVVFGAGASHDSIDVKPPGAGNPGWEIDEEFRPPLAKDLFGPRKLFADAISRFPQLQSVVPVLRNPHGKLVEAALRELQEEGSEYPEAHRQIMAVRYYLQFVLRECERGWRTASKNVTNYKVLLNGINRWRRPDDVVCLVTFNYDTLIEDAIRLFGTRSDQTEVSDVEKVDQIVFGNPFYKLFKLHGSVNWARTVQYPINYPNNNA